MNPSASRVAAIIIFLLVAVPLFFMVVPSPDDIRRENRTPAEKQAHHAERELKDAKMMCRNATFKGSTAPEVEKKYNCKEIMD